MEYLKCVRCGLEIRTRPARVQIENCPRCLARGATLSPMVRVAEALSPSVGWGARAPDAQVVVTKRRAAESRDALAALRRAGISRRASQGVLANAVREMRSHGRERPAR
jgi:hypothetical protein